MDGASCEPVMKLLEFVLQIAPWKPVNTLPTGHFELRLNLLQRSNTWRASCQVIFLTGLFSQEGNKSTTVLCQGSESHVYAMLQLPQEQARQKGSQLLFWCCFLIFFPFLHFFFGPLIICLCL